MCYAKPGPRCSTHAAQRLTAAETKLEQARKLNDPKKHERALVALANAKAEYKLTPDGIAKLRDAGQDLSADIAQSRRDKQLIAYRAANPTLAQIAQWSEERSYAHATGDTTHPKVLTALSQHRKWRVRTLTAENARTPASVLAILADEFPRQVASNPSAPTEVLSKLIHDPQHAYSPAMFAALRNPNTTAADKEAGMGYVTDAEGRYTVGAAAVLLSSRDTPQNELSRLLSHGYSVARHPSCGNTLQTVIASLPPQQRMNGGVEMWSEHQLLLCRGDLTPRALTALAHTYTKHADPDEREAMLSEVLFHRACPDYLKEAYARQAA
ncbi:hypothetical protein FQ330_03235 [Agrococcus sediminis]|uniref:Uncharacterized protein n=1 Tax=Agrococcus sediminis TaxID=2599924 RepID=A0A5M8QQG8_9MICO|nr:hypothetical protein [Agrococcus sediminis]KAA6436432.1 hypothetical protein FQ330_03235 [Agrococcus sediminis]